MTAASAPSHMCLSLPKRAPAALAEILRTPAGRQLGVLGLGRSGCAMASFLIGRGAQVVGIDDHPEAAALANVPALLQRGMRLCRGATSLPKCAALALSPGISPAHVVVQQALRRDIPVFGELELCGALPAPTLAITGTNGKSTTTALAGALLQGLGRRVFVGGNLGTPAIECIARGAPCDALVLELSSYQLETAYSFAPAAAVVLNVTPDHLERYASMAAYAAAKATLVRCVPPQGRVILNADCPVTSAMAAAAQAPVWWFSSAAGPLPGPGVRLQNDALVTVGLPFAATLPLMHPRLLGAHNRSNALAAILGLWALGESPTVTQLHACYVAFGGLPHRLEKVGSLAGVTYINDSKATNDASAATAVGAIQAPLVLMMGGKDKGGGYQQTLAALRSRSPSVRGVVAFGAARAVIAAACAAAAVPLIVVPTFEAALEAAQRLAQAGDVVLLSPACASFDAFANYEARGAAFAAWVARQACLQESSPCRA